MKKHFLPTLLLIFIGSMIKAQTFEWNSLKNGQNKVPYNLKDNQNKNILISIQSVPDNTNPYMTINDPNGEKINGVKQGTTTTYNFDIKDKKQLKPQQNSETKILLFDSTNLPGPYATLIPEDVTPDVEEDNIEGGQDESDGGGNNDDPEALLGYALGYNFLGNAKLNNVTPEIFLGWTENFKAGEASQGSVDVGPVVFPNQGIVDSSSVIPALLLPGNINLVGGCTLEFLLNPTKKTFETGSTIFFSAGVGLKLISSFAYSDTIGSLAQQYGRISAGFKYSDLFTFNGSFVFGGHNLTNESENNYKKIFNTNKTAIQYLLINVQTLISGKSANANKLFLFASWRYLINKQHYQGFTPDRIISIGITQTFDFKKGIRAVSTQSQ